MNVEQRLKDLEKAVEEMIVIPNEWLPEEYHDRLEEAERLRDLRKCANKKKAQKATSKNSKLKT